MEEKIVNYLREYKDILNKKSLEEKNINLFEKYINKVGDIINIIDSLEYKSKADEMFKELGYEKYELKDIIQYVFEGADTIIFEKPLKDIKLYIWNDEARVLAKSINIKELQAINEKVKELGWNE